MNNFTERAATAQLINELAKSIFENNVKVGWWTDKKTGESTVATRNRGEIIALCHSELSECLEGYRKNLMDDHLPHRRMPEVELADTVIRILDLAGAEGFDLGGAIMEKLAYNAQRADHKMGNRQKDNGKQF